MKRKSLIQNIPFRFILLGTWTFTLYNTWCFTHSPKHMYVYSEENSVICTSYCEYSAPLLITHVNTCQLSSNVSFHVLLYYFLVLNSFENWRTQAIPGRRKNTCLTLNDCSKLTLIVTQNRGFKFYLQFFIHR